MAGGLADRIEMQNRLFAELSRMFGAEAPLYDKSLEVNFACNRAVCDLLGRRFPGLVITDEVLQRTSTERHGAIRVGRPDEYRLVTRFFACFGMEPHNFYDMTSIGAKSQPVIATAFRSVSQPEHRVFASLLMTDYFDGSTRERIETLLAERRVFSDEAVALIERCERDGGLSEEDYLALIGEATGRIFKWTGRARDFHLFDELCKAKFKIAADIACFERHHLNHLTPNTLCMDLYTSAMKLCLGESDGSLFEKRAGRALRLLVSMSGPDWLTLHFRHLSRDEVEALGSGSVDEAEIAGAVGRLAARLGEADLRLADYPHSGFKDFTEGPSADTPVLLRQDSYKALTEPVVFSEEDGSEITAQYTARFGEIEQRFYAMTPAGRAVYDQCLGAFEEARAADPGLARRDEDAFERLQMEAFAPIPKSLGALLAQGYVYAVYLPTAQGIAARGSIETTDMAELTELGYVRREGQRYEDFLPVSAAGIFASNLNQYGTASTAQVRPEYARGHLEAIMGRSIIDSDSAYSGVEARSRLETYEALGLLDRLGASERDRLERASEASALAN